VRQRFTWVAWIAAVVAALVLASTATPGGTDGALTQLGSARFPERAFVLTLPEAARLEPSAVRVLENGKPVAGLSVVPASAAGEDEFAVVLVIDATRTMRGAPIEGAIAAARAFAEERNPNQQLAIVTFNNESTVLLPFTTNQAAIYEALSSTPQTRCCTPLYDAVDDALTLLEQAGIDAGSVILLSDGADTGSQVSPEQVTAKARKAHVRIFSVGLRSGAFRRGPLARLAQDTEGVYAEATSPEELKPIYAQIGSMLANEYLIRYRSLAGPGQSIEVQVLLEDGTWSATSTYTTPSLPTKPAPPYHPALDTTLWSSPVTMIVASLLAAALMMGAFLAIFKPRKESLRGRMSGFVAMPNRDEQTRRRPLLTERMLESAERGLEHTRWWSRFKEELEIAQIKIAAVHIVVGTGVVTAIFMWILYGLGGLLFAPLALFLPFIVRWFIQRKLGRRRKLFGEQLPDNLQVLASALRAGHSFVGALSVVVDDSPAPSRDEFRRVIADEQLGVPLQDALDEVARRMDNRDLEQVSLVAALQRETGGNTAEVLDRVTDTIRERFELRRLVKTLTAQGRMSRWVVSALPVVLLGVITLINPGYMEPLYSTGTGRGLLVGAGLFVVFGSIVIGRIVNIKV
jgi:tight adherence protein B